ncbi:MAG: amino acid racemase [Candidatus Pacebacteria bacterium]|nr:amino acid racemase [Candidatus Paceibacterota bacterium]PIR60786.1 MAG: aspartate/glutamate racemase [Candidatus Pacebacteria bacterium CG10_big_fil_rev_8_21_14_0_10_44_54]
MHKPKKSKLLGLIGGVSWTSTLEYYKRFNQQVYLARGGYESARLLLTSVNFAEILALQQAGDSDLEAEFLIRELLRLERGGADCALICSNTTNKTIDALRKAVSVPLISLPESVAVEARRLGIRRLGLLGTSYTMYGSFYRECLESHGLAVSVPEKQLGSQIHNIIYEELVKGAVLQRSAEVVDAACTAFAAAGVDTVVLGCTELPLLRSKLKTSSTLLDTIDIHIARALNFAYATN